MIALRQRHPALVQNRFLVGDFIAGSQSRGLVWIRPDGGEMDHEDWQKPWISSLGFMLGGDAIRMLDDKGDRVVGDGLLVLLNAHHAPINFQLPSEGGTSWLLEIDTGDPARESDATFSGEYEVGGRALVMFRQPLEATVAREAAMAPERLARAEGQRRRRRAGILVPLFSIRSQQGWGLGEIADIPHFAGWASQAGFSVLQLLPVNEVSAADPSPYAALSAFALDPVYLSPDACADFKAAGAVRL